MPSRTSFDYSIVRVMPRIDRGELVNAGVILYCLRHDFLEARIALDEARVLALCPTIDLTVVRAHLAAIPRICAGDADAGPIARLAQKERWHWLVAPRSTIIQMSPVHAGLCEDPRATLEALVDKLVRA